MGELLTQEIWIESLEQELPVEAFSDILYSQAAYDMIITLGELYDELQDIDVDKKIETNDEELDKLYTAIEHDGGESYKQAMRKCNLLGQRAAYIYVKVGTLAREMKTPAQIKEFAEAHERFGRGILLPKYKMFRHKDMGKWIPTKTKQVVRWVYERKQIAEKERREFVRNNLPTPLYKNGEDVQTASKQTGNMLNFIVVGPPTWREDWGTYAYDVVRIFNSGKEGNKTITRSQNVLFRRYGRRLADILDRAQKSPCPVVQKQLRNEDGKRGRRLAQRLDRAEKSPRWKE